MTSPALLRVYAPEECTEPGRQSGYPFAWHRCPACLGDGVFCEVCEGAGSIKDLIRQLAEHRCVRCRHPYRKGEEGAGEFSLCDERCAHRGPYSWRHPTDGSGTASGGYQEIRDRLHRGETAGQLSTAGYVIRAHWRILTVHHLNEVKADCRWWNLISLCQRCHLNVQRRVKLHQPWPFEHSEWFKPYAAGFYASSILHQELTREETMGRLEELLALEHRQDRLPGIAA